MQVLCLIVDTPADTRGTPAQKLTLQAMGLIPEWVRANIGQRWQLHLERIAAIAVKQNTGRS
jgi:hypothetical protein